MRGGGVGVWGSESAQETRHYDQGVGPTFTSQATALLGTVSRSVVTDSARAETAVLVGEVHRLVSAHRFP
eukprot:1063490-Rhodomonas_salina.1